MADQEWKDQHMPSEKVKAIRRAAVSFANDYGPLPAANRGDENAQHEIATRMVNMLRREGLSIIRDQST